jgi:hypothetical protein
MLPTLGRPRDPARQALGDAALDLGTLDGAHRHPGRYSRRFVDQVVKARKVLGEDRLPRIRLHDLRHTHATPLLAAGEPVKVVLERIGHASATITLSVYQHVHPGVGRQAADRLAALLRGRGARSIAAVYRGPRRSGMATPGLLTCRNAGMRLCPRGDTLHTHTPPAAG